MSQVEPPPGLGEADLAIVASIAGRPDLSVWTIGELIEAYVRTGHEGGLEAFLFARGILPSGEVAVTLPAPIAARMPEAGGRYRDLVEIGRGAGGVVYRAIDGQLERPVAIKFLIGESSGRRRERFLREARILGQLEHPNIPPVHEMSIDGPEDPYFVMKWVEGRTLAGVLAAVARGGPEAAIGERFALLAVFGRVCDAIRLAHARGIVHRDLKPANVLVGDYGEVMVTDWGIARRIGELPIDGDLEQAPSAGEADLTRTGDVLGTPLYMAPEQASGRSRAVDPRADVYALGAILYEILTLERAFDGADVVAIREAKLTGRVEPPTARVPAAAVGAELEAVVRRAMALCPDDRYPSVELLAADVGAYLEGRPLAALDYSPIGLLAKWVGRHRALTIVAVAGFVALTAATAGYLVSLARKNRDLEDQRQRLEASARVAAGRLEEITRQADQRGVETLERAADDLWPVHPDTVDALAAWLDEARQILGRLDDHRRHLETLRGRAPSAETTRQERRMARLVEVLEAWSDPVSGRIAEIERRLFRSRSLVGRSIDRHAGRWSEAIASIADRQECPLYEGLSIEPQIGLVPLGRNAAGLWEFVHIESGSLPEDSDSPAAGDGIVLILVPGGRFAMGEASGYEFERPVHEVDLAPYFLARYEMTQAQWLRATGRSPSIHGGPLRPVESVSWLDCRLALARLGLELPTEAQWERACRAGTTMRWWTGDDSRSIEGAANLSDRAARREGALGGALGHEDWLDDGQAVHGPVGGYRSNPWGFHDMIGNVTEWCLDGYARYQAPVEPGHGLRLGDEAKRAVRGGSYFLPAVRSRSASRMFDIPSNSNAGLGVRPARSLAVGRG